ncbi:MAG: hypothetical protein UT58_C0016G0007 [Microgenomates group bacterium GW2011_GWC1_39_7b]|nr:MAG: hypothetical protein UT58_C0016G0007 [Microgenomates group bacterium GW2011_GWC1_39_7b]
MGVFSLLADFHSFPIVLVLFYLNFIDVKNRTYLKIAFFSIGTLVFLILPLTNPRFTSYLFKQSLLNYVLPKSYDYLLQERMSYGQVRKTPLIIQGVNFSRLAFNKPHYTLDNTIKFLLTTLDLDKLSSGLMAQSTVSRDNNLSDLFPKIFLWQYPLIIFGLLLAISKIKNPYRTFFFALFLPPLFFGDRYLIFTLPTIALSCALAIYTFIKVQNHKLMKLTISTVFFFLMIASTLSSLDIFLFHWDTWIPEQDLRQFQIWKTLSDKEITTQKITVTDRFGEPAFYYLYYLKVNPSDFLETSKDIKEISPGVQRINSIANLYFRSFKYYESDRKPDQIWIGLAGEFSREAGSYGQVSTVVDGEIYKKIGSVKSGDKRLGDELWFVRTVFNKL